MAISYFTTAIGWAVVVGVGGGIYYISHRNNRTRHPQPPRQPARPAGENETRQQKSKKERKDGNQSAGDKEGKTTKATSNNQKKRKNAKAVKEDGEDRAQTTARATKDTDGDDEVDNREFARQLSNAKAGTISAPKTNNASRQKSVKQNRAQEKRTETSADNATGTSSTNADDADDDQSPANSPDLTATNMSSPVTNGGISDMLEKPAPGPSVLRVTEPTNPSPQKKAKPQTTFETAETKKQRQNRKKAEAKKLAREEDEKERKKLMEQQRRTAREAEGRAAKDGSAFMAAKAPSSSAWTGSAPAINGNGNRATSSSNVDLLDTTIDEPSSKKAAPSVPAENFSESELQGSDWAKYSAGLSEEEQIQRINMEDNQNWQTVSAKEKKRKAAKKAAQAAQKDGKAAKDEKAISTDEEEYGVPPKIAPTGPGKEWEVTTVHVKDGKAVEQTKVVQDSDWEAAPTEWEVA
jgi:hypothetical protein